MSKRADLEALRAMLADRRTHLVVGKVDKVAPLVDKSAVRVQVTTLPEEMEMVATCGWAATGPSAGIFGGLPVPGDLVLLGLPDNDMAYVIARLTSTEDTIPWQAMAGHLILQALAGKKSYLVSDEGILIGRGSLAPMEAKEPLVLGLVMKSCLTDIYARLHALADKMEAIAAAIVTGPVAVDSIGGSATCHPTLTTALGASKTAGIRLEIDGISDDLDDDEAKYVDTAATNVVSQIAFTER